MPTKVFDLDHKTQTDETWLWNVDEFEGVDFYSEFDRDTLGYTPLMTYLSRTKKQPSCERIRAFVKLNSDINAKSKEGKDAFCFALANHLSTVQTFETLLELGANVHSCNGEG